jgi:hypothetical protein
MPIPDVPEGFVMPGSGPATNTTLDVFFDHLCASSAVMIPVLYQWWSNPDVSSWLKMRVHVFPLPYHHNSFTVAVAGRWVQENYPLEFSSFMLHFFDIKNNYLDSDNSTETQIREMLAADTEACTGAPARDVLAGVTSDGPTFDLAWVSW